MKTKQKGDRFELLARLRIFYSNRKNKRVVSLYTNYWTNKSLMKNVIEEGKANAFLCMSDIIRTKYIS